MNRKTSVLMLCSALMLGGCGDHDEAYYIEHPNEATEKLKSCEADMLKAMMNKDKSALDKASKEPECLAADKALKTIRQRVREQKERERKAKEQALRAEAEKAFNEKYGNLSWQEYIKAYAKSDCAGKIFFSNNLNEASATCMVMNEHHEAAINKGVQELLQNSFDQLIQQRDQYCRLDERRGSVCDVWREAIKQSAQQQFKDMAYVDMAKQRSNYCPSKDYVICSSFDKVLDGKRHVLIQHFSENDEDYKREYNNCYEKAQKIENPGIFGGGYRIAQDDPLCGAVNQATLKRGLNDARDFKKPF